MAILDIPLTNVQPTLVSGTNIKTINGTSILGSGNLVIASGVSIGDTIGSGTAGSVLFLGASNVLEQDNAYLNYNPTTKRLAIGLGSASGMAHIKTQTATDIGLIVQGTTSQTGNLFEIRQSADKVLFWAKYDANEKMQLWFGDGNGNNAQLFSYVGANFINSNSHISINESGTFFSNAATILSSSSGLLAAPFVQNSYLNHTATARMQSVQDTDNGTKYLFKGSYSSAPNTYVDKFYVRDDGAMYAASDFTLLGNLVSNTGSGIQIATAATQKIGIWGATPVTRVEAMATSISYSSIGGTSVRANDTWGGYTILTAIATLKGLGILP